MGFFRATKAPRAESVEHKGMCRNVAIYVKGREIMVGGGDHWRDGF